MLNTPESGLICASCVGYGLYARLVTELESIPLRMVTIYPSHSTSDNPFAGPIEDAPYQM